MSEDNNDVEKGLSAEEVEAVQEVAGCGMWGCGMTVMVPVLLISSVPLILLLGPLAWPIIAVMLIGFAIALWRKRRG